MQSPIRLSVLLLPSLVLAWSCATVPDVTFVDDVDPTLPQRDASSARGTEIGEPILDATIVDDAFGSSVSNDAGSPAPLPSASLMSLAISEVMFNPSGPEPDGESIEVYNGSDEERSLDGLTLRDGAARTHVISGHVVIAPGAYAVLARSRDGAVAAGVPAEAIAYEYGAGLSDSEGILLSNGASGGVAILAGATVITSCAYGGLGYGGSEGSSVQRTGDDGDGGPTWCLAAPTPGYALDRTSCALDAGPSATL